MKMIDKLNKPRRAYSKSSAFYVGTKSIFFDGNDSMLAKAQRQNELYKQQPLRKQCKICGQLLSTKSDFFSHQVGYVFCTNCGHLNGIYADTEAFAEHLYIQDEGASYAKNYLDNNFKNRATEIYAPKLEFLCSALAADTKARRQKLLDIGCGCGYFVYAALLKGIEAIGVDVSQAMIEFGNLQISHLVHEPPLTHSAESDFSDLIVKSDATVISAIGVIEHLRDPDAFFDAFHRSNAQYLFYSVPMFSFSVMLENVFQTIFPRQLSGGHTHLFTEQSLKWLHNNRSLEVQAEWRFGTDVMDLYRSMLVEMKKSGASQKTLDILNDGLGKNIDQLQAVFDKSHFCSEVHCVVTKS